MLEVLCSKEVVRSGVREERLGLGVVCEVVDNVIAMAKVLKTREKGKGRRKEKGTCLKNLVKKECYHLAKYLVSTNLSMLHLPDLVFVSVMFDTFNSFSQTDFIRLDSMYPYYFLCSM